MTWTDAKHQTLLGMIKRDVSRSEMARILGKSKNQIALRVKNIHEAHKPLSKKLFKKKWKGFCERKDLPFVEYGT